MSGDADSVLCAAIVEADDGLWPVEVSSAVETDTRPNAATSVSWAIHAVAYNPLMRNPPSIKSCGLEPAFVFFIGRFGEPWMVFVRRRHRMRSTCSQPVREARGTILPS